MLRTLTLLALISLSAPAWADVTGRYRGPDGAVMTVEVDDTGVSRVGREGSAEYTLLDGSDGFIVTTEGGEAKVLRLSDFQAVMREAFGGLFDGAAETPAGESGPAVRWAPAGAATVEGRTGTEYRLAEAPTPDGERIVLSDDPQLVPLGRAWSRAFRLLPAFGPFGPGASITALGATLETHGPLQLGDIRLVGASFDDIDPARFVLPAQPLTREQIAAMMEARRGAGSEE